MSLIARIIPNYLPTTYPDQNGGSVERADLYLCIFDAETGQPANGNNSEVTYEVNDGGNIELVTITVPGQSTLLYPQYYRELWYNSQGELTYERSVDIRIVSFVPGTDTIPPNPCNLAISHISIDSAESIPGALDGSVTIHASSNYQPITYSTNDTDYQSSATFDGLSGGLKTFYARDANGCKVSSIVTVPVISDLLIADPSVTLPDGNISRWNAAFNPIVFTYQRKDFHIISVTSDTLTGYATFKLNAMLDNSNNPLKEGDKVYISTNLYKGIFDVANVTNSSELTVNSPFLEPDGVVTGFVNINKLRPYYKITTRITYQENFTGATRTITSANRPDGTGLVKADLSNFLQSLLTAKDNSDYTLGNYRDDNLSASYSIAYVEEWEENGAAKTSAFIPVNQPYYVVYAAKQLGERYGGNLAAYVPFAHVANGLPKAKWISDFDEPAYSNGYPFDIGFIYSEDMLGRHIYCEFTLLDINRNALPGGSQTSYLLNDDGSWLLNSDDGKFIIARQSSGTMPVPGQLGLNRLLIDALFAGDVYYIDIALKYADEHGVHTITQTQTIRVDDAVDENSVYLRWIGLTGSWNYYRFVYNQEVSLDVQNAVIIKNYVTDWEYQQGIEDVMSKTAGQKVKVVAEDLLVADIKGLQSIKYSPKVQLLVNRNPVKWQTIIINTATYSEYETRYGQAPFSVTFNLPAINIQTQ